MQLCQNGDTPPRWPLPGWELGPREAADCLWLCAKPCQWHLDEFIMCKPAARILNNLIFLSSPVNVHGYMLLTHQFYSILLLYHLKHQIHIKSMYQSVLSESCNADIMVHRSLMESSIPNRSIMKSEFPNTLRSPS